MTYGITHTYEFIYITLMKITSMFLEFVDYSITYLNN